MFFAKMENIYCNIINSNYIDSMTISNKTLHLIKNSHLEETDMLLNKLLKDADMSQAQFAKAVGKDASTVNRWIKNNRSIAWENAEKIAEILNCHPVDVYRPKKEIKLRSYAQWDGYVKDYEKEDQYLINVPYEYYHKNIRAVQMECPGNHSDGEIWLFDLPATKKFYKNAIGKICYLTASKKFQEKNQKLMKETGQKCHPLIALLKAKGNGKMMIVNSYTDEPINPLCTNLDPEDLEYATPVKAKYDPDMVNFTIK